MTQVVPAIIPESRDQMEEEVSRVSSFAETIQIDISDGIFSSTKTWPYNGIDTEYFEELKDQTEGWPHWDDLDIELHLMIKNPEDSLEDWISTGVKSIVAHVEATLDFQKIIDICKKNSVSVGIAIKPSTDNSKISAFANQVDFIQVMGSDKIGSHGILLEDSAIQKIKSLHTLYPERIISIDIGVTVETASTLVEAGVSKLVSGSEILDADDPEEIYRELESF